MHDYGVFGYELSELIDYCSSYRMQLTIFPGGKIHIHGIDGFHFEYDLDGQTLRPSNLRVINKELFRRHRSHEEAKRA